MEKQVKLKVTEALQEDAYKGIARIDAITMKKLGVAVGDVILIKGEKATVATVDRAYPADVGEGIIRIDSLTRKNAKVGIGDLVTVSRAEVVEAKRVTIAPVQQGVSADEDTLKAGLLGRACLPGDVVSLGGVKRRRELMGSYFEDLNELFPSEFFPFEFGFSSMASARFVIVSCTPKLHPGEAAVITEKTEITLLAKPVEVTEKVIGVTYDDIGGLDEEIKKVREMIELPLKYPELFERLGIEPPKGVLLYGPPGCGKTLLARAVANETDANFYVVNGPEIMSKYYGESEKRIREIFEEAKKNAPSIIFIDEIDAIAPKREESYGEVEKRVVSQLLTMMDGLEARGKVIVIGATNMPNILDPALRRPGRFDREIAIGVPNTKGRLAILKIHTRNMPLAKDVSLEELAEVTHGFVGADIAALCKEAAMHALRRLLPELKLEKEEEERLKHLLEKLKVTKKDFEAALRVVRPSAMREVLVEKPNVRWEDIGGLAEAKQLLKETIEWPLKKPEVFKRMGIKPPKGVLLYGPPGTGKTLLIKAVATETEANFIEIKGPELLSKWVGESERGIRKVFERARQVAPCIIFFDEIDALAPRRGLDTGTHVTERVVNQLLAEMDGLEELSNIIVIGATNRIDMLDPALLRPGRFDRIITTDVPNKEERLAILKIHTRNMPLAKDVSLEELAEVTHGFVGADIAALCKEAAMHALRENINAKQVTKADFEYALNKIKPSVTEQEAKAYKEVAESLMRKRKTTERILPYMG